MSHAIPVFAAIALCLAAAFVVSWDLAPLVCRPAAAVHPRCACGHTPGGHYASGQCSTCDCRCTKLRARRPAATANPDGTAAAPAAAAVPLDRSTRDDLKVINAGGMLLPDRPRETPEPGPFRIPPYYEAWEQGRWME